MGQTAVVVAWILVNAVHLVRFDLYPFILLNLGFSLQAAYAAPLILLASTRQADRDKLSSEADAKHREELSEMQLARQAEVKQMLTSNTDLTEQVHRLSQENKKLAEAIESHVLGDQA